MKTLVYLRTSTEEQNPENQLKDCLTLVKGEYEVIEEKESAFKDKIRPLFESVKTKIKSKELEDLVVWDLDRLFRNRKKLIEFFEFCKIYKIKIHSFRQQWLEQLNNIPEPFNEIMHSLMLQIMGWIAEEESQKKSERVRNSIRIKDNQTISYKGNKWGRKSISTQAVNKIIELFNKGLTIREIAKQVEYADKNKNMKNVSRGLVHKIITQYKQAKDSKREVHKLSN